MEVQCLDDSNRPSVIPISKWVKKGNLYNVLEVVKCNVQGGILGFKLEEIQLGADELPYKYFAATRFSIPIPDNIVEEIEELQAV